jgi:hypothetical protein
VSCQPLDALPVTGCSSAGEYRHKIAQDSTRLPAYLERVWVEQEGFMDRATIEPAITVMLTEISSKLNEAARIANAAEACALSGSIAEG